MAMSVEAYKALSQRTQASEIVAEAGAGLAGVGFLGAAAEKMAWFTWIAKVGLPFLAPIAPWLTVAGLGILATITGITIANNGRREMNAASQAAAAGAAH